MFEWFGEFWCKRRHGKVMWPVNRHYVCSTCLREYPINWENDYNAPRAESGAVHESTCLTRSRSSSAVNGFCKKCTSVTGTP